MTIRNRIRPAVLASALGLLPLLGCIGASDDRLGSEYGKATGAGDVNGGNGIQTSTQQYRDDKGDNPRAGTGTGRPNSGDDAKTGGLGENRSDVLPGPGSTGPATSSGVASGPK